MVPPQPDSVLFEILRLKLRCNQIRTLQSLYSTNTQPAIKALHKLLAPEGQNESMKM